MTTFPTTPPPLTAPVVNAAGAAVDSRRTVRRATIAELNDLDYDTIRERLQSSRIDDRPSWVKGLDLIDAPRNLLISTVFPSLERKARERGDVGTGGVGKVFGSDVLESAGVSNRVVKAIAGFGLDILTDPLTFLGPAGAGLRVSSKTGQVARVGLRGRRAIDEGLSAVAKGGIGAVRDPDTARLFRTMAEGLDDVPATNQALSQVIGGRLLGPVTSGRVGRALSRVGGEVEHGGGALAELLDKFGESGVVGAQAQAVRDWMARYGAGTGGGLRIGKGATGKTTVAMGPYAPGKPIATSTIAHIPFTDFGIHVPAFTGEGRAAAQQLRIATATNPASPVQGLGPTLAAATPLVREMQDLEAALTAGPLPDGPVPSMARFDELKTQIDGLLRRHSETPVETATPNGLGEMLALRKVADEADAAAKLAKARASAGGPIDEYASAVHEAMENYARSVRGSVKQFASTQDVETQRMVARMFGTDDDRLGASLLTPVRAVAGMMGDPSIAADITNRVDNAGKAVFGQPPGHLRDMQRAYRNGLSFGSREGYAATESAIRKEIVDVMRAADLNPSNLDDYRAAVQLTTAHMYAIRNKEAAARGADDVFFTKKFGSDEPAEWVQHLQRAQEGGILGKASEQLKQIAQRNVGMLKTMADYEYADDILGIPIEGYISGIPTPAAALEIAKTNRQRMVDKSVRGTMRKAAGEAFQKRKMSYQYRWESPSGGMRRFFEKDRWVQDFPDESIAQIAKESPQDAADIVKLRETINEYDTLAKDPAWAEKHAPRQTDNWEMNELHRNGEFSLLTGSEILPDGFMETNAATLMAGRVMAHERAVARKTWAEYVKQQGVAVDAAKMQGTRQEGNTLLLKDGSVAKFYQDKNGLWGVEQNGQRFRPLRAEFATDTRNPMTETLGDTTGLLYHEDVARAIEDVASVYDEPNELLKFLDSATAAWKTTTLAHPSWTIGNLIGDSVNQLTNGARIADMAQDAGPMMKIIANVHNPEKLKDLWVEGVRGQDIRGDQLVNDLREANLIGTNAVAETALQWHSRGHFILPSLVGGAEGRSFIDQFRPSMLKSDFMERLSHENAARRVAAGARAAGFVAKDRFIRGFLRPWFRVNERMNDYVKALAYLSFLRQGYDMPSATRKVIRAGFDYSDSTRIERDFFKRMWPFYSFMRLNGAYQMKLLLSRPIYAGSFPLLHHAVEEAINGDAKVPLHARPSWMRQQMALQVGSDPNERFALILGNLLPQEQAFAGLSAVRGAATLDQQAIADTANYLVGSLNPLVRTPLEVGAGREFFSDRTIGGDPASADLTVGDAVLNQIRPIRELPKIAQAFGEQGVGAGLARSVIGGRAQPMSEERVRSSLTREFTDKEQRIRTALRRAERTGDTGARAEANLKLMLLYKAMLERGLQESVPKWARERLAGMMPQEAAV